MIVEMVMPQMGESVVEGTITKWLKKPGDAIQEKETLLEISTDKVDSEIPASKSGILVEILVPAGETVPIGTKIALIDTEAVQGQTSSSSASSAKTSTSTSAKAKTSTAQASPRPETSTPLEISTPLEDPSLSSRFYSPLVQTIAREEKISLSELESVPGTGADGRVTKNDILAYIARKRKKASEDPEEQDSIETLMDVDATEIQKINKEFQTPLPPTPSIPSKPPTTVSSSASKTFSPSFAPVSSPTKARQGQDTIIEMDAVRQKIATHMVQSKQVSAHVNTISEVDMTAIVKYRESVKERLKNEEGINLTYTAFMIHAAARALREFPRVNAQVDGTKIIEKAQINIGMAVALPDGNLIVPVIKNADQLNLIGLAHLITDLSERARSKKLKLDDVTGGTFTLTNMGSFGSLFGTPIINQPQVAILGAGVIKSV